MKKLLIFNLLIFSLSIHAKCIDPIKDYSEYFGTPEDSEYLKFDTNVRTKSDFVIAAKDSCGSRGCEYALYAREGDCYKRYFDFAGNYKVEAKKTNGFKNITVIYKDGHLSKKVTKEYIFSPKEKYYVELK